MTANAIAKVSYTHDAMIDLLIANPALQQGELGTHFGYTAGWVSRIIRSDAFQERLAARKKELTDPIVLQTVEEKFDALIHRSLEILQTKLDANPTAELALKAADLGARARGYGAKASGPSVQANIQFVVHTPQKAASTQAWIDTVKTVNG